MSVKCKICSKSIYPNDPQINLDGSKFHKPCAKCADCNCQITLSNFTKNESSDQTMLLCKTHYFKRFHEGGSYVGGDKFKNKASRDTKIGTAPAPVNSEPVQTVFAVANDISPVVSRAEPAARKEIECPPAVEKPVKHDIQNEADAITTATESSISATDSEIVASKINEADNAVDSIVDDSKLEKSVEVLEISSQPASISNVDLLTVEAPETSTD